MTKDEFWDLIARSRTEGTDEDTQIEALSALLNDLPEATIEAFGQIQWELYERAYRWDVWAAGIVINGGMSDDSFSDFRQWLIACGRRVFEDALRDPDTLADVPDTGEGLVLWESFAGVADDVYEDRFGRELLITAAKSTGPAGEPWTDDEFADHLPRLCAKFRWDG